MRCCNGVLRTGRDATLRLKLQAQSRKLTWLEYLPLVLLGMLLTVLLLAAGAMLG